MVLLNEMRTRRHEVIEMGCNVYPRQFGRTSICRIPGHQRVEYLENSMLRNIFVRLSQGMSDPSPLDRKGTESLLNFERISVILLVEVLIEYCSIGQMTSRLGILGHGMDEICSYNVWFYRT